MVRYGCFDATDISGKIKKVLDKSSLHVSHRFVALVERH